MNNKDIKKAVTIFTKAYNDYFAILDEKDLKRNRLTFAEYTEVKHILMKLSKIVDKKKTETIMSGVSEWFKRRNFNVQEKGIGWVITII